MSKKNLSGGLNSLLGDQPKEKAITPAQKRAINKRAKYSALLEESNKLVKQLRDQPDKPKVGRPVTQTKEITKSSQDGTKENETRATFIINEELLEKVKAIAYWERELIKETINKALQETVAKYEKKNGDIQPIPKK